MDHRKPTRAEKDLPVIGDYSAQHDALLRRPADDAPAPRPAPARRPALGQDERLLLDPSDVRRHSERLRQREPKGPLAKVLRYSPIALAAAAAFGVYRNFDTLRGISVSFAPLRNLSGGGTPVTSNAAAPLESEPEAEPVGAPAIVTADALGDTDAPAMLEVLPADAAADAPLAAPRPTTPEPAAEDDSPAPSVALAEEAAGAEFARVPPPAPAAPPGPETFVFGLPTHTVSEADAAVAVLILRNGGSNGESFVTWWTTGDTATPGVDYVDAGTVTERFPPGAQNRTIRIPLVGDRIAEGSETFHIHLSAPEGATVPPERARMEIIISDDD